MQTRTIFPDPRKFPGIDGVVFVGGDLEISTLVRAYSLGIFPWPCEDLPLLWHCPEERGVLFFQDFHVPKRLMRLIRTNRYHVTFNQKFNEVIDACAKQKRKDQSGTWILDDIRVAYKKLHEAGYAHSVECWEQDQLVGGLYGVYVDGIFCGESMFNRKSDAAKICLVAAVNKLSSLGLKWIDTQMVTPLTSNFGGKYIKKFDFLDMMDEIHAKRPQHKIRMK